MSHIAAALAKSKGKSVTPPAPGTPLAQPASVRPLPMPVSNEAPVVAKPKTKKKIPLPLALGAGALVLAIAGWYLMPSGKTATAPTKAPAGVSPPVSATKPTVNATVPVASGSRSATVAPGVATTSAAPPVAPLVVGSQADLQEQVSRLVVTGRRISGGSQRAVINGKVYVPGDQVTETLTLHEVQGDRVVLRDASGNLYQR